MEEARARLLELAPGGFEEVSGAGWVELAAYVDDAGERVLLPALPDATVEPVEDGWEDRWRAFHHPVRAGGLWIGPPWEQPPADEPAVVVDPGRAFGTGTHATTRLCIELLARSPRSSVLDAGCGSGVVAVAAARLGFEPVYAVDVDEVAVAVARQTAVLNGVSIDVRRSDALSDDLPTADLLVANIELGPVTRLLERGLWKRAVTSGYLVHQEVSAPGWERADRLESDGWAAETVFRPEPH